MNSDVYSVMVWKEGNELVWGAFPLGCFCGYVDVVYREVITAKDLEAVKEDNTFVVTNN